jgi:RNA polymerase sigma factor (TIGR02999 family)
MSDVTRILTAMDLGDPAAAEELLPLVYAELRNLAAQKLARERPGQTLQATALVHEAYLHLVGTHDPGWNGRGHFFAAAAEAMRRILIDQARKRRRAKRGGDHRRLELTHLAGPADIPDETLLDLDDALARFAESYPRAAKVLELRYFAGLHLDEIAAALAISRRTAERDWKFARAWLIAALDPA